MTDICGVNRCPILSLPADCILRIICSLSPKHSYTSAYDLHALFITCRRINNIMVTYRNNIIEHYTVMIITNDTTSYLLCGYMHRGNDLPAKTTIKKRVQCIYNGPHDSDELYVEITEIMHSWYRCGWLHRDNGPAVITTDGTWEEHKWYHHGILINSEYKRVK